jgi:hypothetical protein
VANEGLAAWMADDLVYLSVGTVPEADLADQNSIEIPQRFGGEPPLQGLAFAKVCAVRISGDSSWTPTGKSKIMPLSLRAAAVPAGARIGDTVAATLGIANGEFVTLKAPRKRELMRISSRRSDATAIWTGILIALASLIAAVVGTKLAGWRLSVLLACLALSFTASLYTAFSKWRIVTANER